MKRKVVMPLWAFVLFCVAVALLGGRFDETCWGWPEALFLNVFFGTLLPGYMMVVSMITVEMKKETEK